MLRRMDGVDQVLKLMEENRQLTEAADAFEERLHHETRRAEKRRLSAENRAELEVICLPEGWHYCFSENFFVMLHVIWPP